MQSNVTEVFFFFFEEVIICFRLFFIPALAQQQAEVLKQVRTIFITGSV